MTRGSMQQRAFLFAEYDRAAELWEAWPTHAAAVLARFGELVGVVAEAHAGCAVASPLGTVVAGFAAAEAAVAAAVAAQRTLREASWPDRIHPGARMAIASGAGDQGGGGLAGPGPARAARIAAAAHGGQILLDAGAAAALDGAELVDLGVHQLRDLPRGERLFQLQVEGSPTQFPILRTQAARPGNLAVPSTRLIGRDEGMDALLELVRAHRLVTLSGVGGVGKTRLASEIGVLLANEHPDGVWVIELAALTDAALVPNAIASTMGITPRAGVPLLQTVADAVDGRRMLVILDNCEHLIDGAAETVRALLQRTTTARVLCTSREALDLPGEQRWPVLPLGLDGGAASPAVALFVERSRALRSAIDLDETRTAAVVVEVCRQVDGLPLGIELAAARTLSMSPIDLRDRLNDRLDVLGSATSRVPQRQQTLRHVVSWSYELLDEPERALLKQAAVFHGGFDAAGVAAVSGAPDELAVLDLLDSLVRKSLVVADHRSGNVRFGLLETVRQFAEDELAVQGTLEQARERHAAFFAEGAVARGSTWNGPAWRDCADWVDTELANLRSAFRWARSHDRLELAVDIAAHAAYMGGSIQLFECVAWAEELLEVAVDAEPIHLPRLYTAAAWGCFTGRPADAVDAARAAQRLEDDSRYEPYEAGLSGLMEALAHVYDGHLDRYVEAAERVVAVGGRARGWGLSLLLDGLQASGRVNEALALTEAAMAEARALGNPFFIAYAYWTCGGAHAKRDPARALELWRDGLDFVRRHRVDFFVGFIARDAARLHLADANPDDALAMFDESINVFERAGNVAQLTITLASATALLERIGRFDRAVTLFAAITRQPASEHHVPELAELGARLRATLGEDAFRAHVEEAATMDLNATAQFARAEVQRARVELQAQTASRVERPGGLSVREVEVLQLLAQGLRTQDIAKRLYISAKTADRHIQNLYLKIGASNRATATRWASEHGLMT